MRKIKGFLVILTIAVLGTFAAGNIFAEESKKSIVKIEGNSLDDRYSIVIRENASEIEEKAAKELQEHLNLITGEELVIRKDNEKINSPVLLVGNSKKFKKLRIKVNLSGLEEEEFIIKSFPPNIVMAGGGGRGTLYSVYTFLEKLGVRWYAPGVTVIPEGKSIVVNLLDIHEKPGLEYRGLLHTGGGEEREARVQWEVRNKINFLEGSPAKNQLVEETIFRARHYGHNWHHLVPASYFNTHPEYFAMVDGRRKEPSKYSCMLCLSNPDVKQIWIDTITKRFDEHPEDNLYSLCVDDAHSYCECENCRKMDVKPGFVADRRISFYNSVIKEVLKKHPDKYFYTYAYTRAELDPPFKVRPHKNLLIQLYQVTPGACHIHPMSSCKGNAELRSRLNGWLKTTPNVFLGSYMINYMHYFMPYPNVMAICSDMLFLKEIGAKGISYVTFYPDRGKKKRTAEWIAARMMWNPDADPRILIKDYMEGYYGKAAPAMEKYFWLMENAAAKGPCMHFYSPPSTVFFTRDL